MRVFNTRKCYSLAFRLLKSSCVGAVLLVTVSLYSFFLLLGLVNDDVREIALRRFHVDLPFVSWALLQPIPSMYSYDNKAIAIMESGEEIPRQVNHHIYRLFGDAPSWNLYEIEDVSKLVFVSKYRKTEVRTEYPLIEENGRIYVER